MTYEGDFKVQREVTRILMTLNPVNKLLARQKLNLLSPEEHLILVHPDIIDQEGSTGHFNISKWITNRSKDEKKISSNDPFQEDEAEAMKLHMAQKSYLTTMRQMKKLVFQQIKQAEFRMRQVKCGSHDPYHNSSEQLLGESTYTGPSPLHRYDKKDGSINASSLKQHSQTPQPERKSSLQQKLPSRRGSKVIGPLGSILPSSADVHYVKGGEESAFFSMKTEDSSSSPSPSSFRSLKKKKSSFFFTQAHRDEEDGDEEKHHLPRMTSGLPQQQSDNGEDEDEEERHPGSVTKKMLHKKVRVDMFSGEEIVDDREEPAASVELPPIHHQSVTPEPTTAQHRRLSKKEEKAALSRRNSLIPLSLQSSVSAAKLLESQKLGMSIINGGDGTAGAALDQTIASMNQTATSTSEQLEMHKLLMQFKDETASSLLASDYYIAPKMKQLSLAERRRRQVSAARRKGLEQKKASTQQTVAQSNNVNTSINNDDSVDGATKEESSKKLSVAPLDANGALQQVLTDHLTPTKDGSPLKPPGSTPWSKPPSSNISPTRHSQRKSSSPQIRSPSPNDNTKSKKKRKLRVHLKKKSADDSNKKLNPLLKKEGGGTNIRSLLSGDHGDSEDSDKDIVIGIQPGSKALSHANFLLDSHGESNGFIMKSTQKIDSRAIERKFKYWKKFSALDLHKPLTNFTSSDQILQHVEKVISKDEQISQREEEYKKEKKWFGQMECYCVENYTNPLVREILDRTAKCITIERPPVRSHFFTEVMEPLSKTDMLLNDVVSTAIHCGTVFSLSKEEVVEYVRKRAWGFVVDRRISLGKVLPDVSDMVSGGNQHVVIK